MPNRALRIDGSQSELLPPETGQPAAMTGEEGDMPGAEPPRQAGGGGPLAGEEAMVRAFAQLRAAVRRAAEERQGERPQAGSDPAMPDPGAAPDAAREVLAALPGPQTLREDALFSFGPGAGQVFLSGGAGWTEVVRLRGVAGGPGPDGWSFHLEAGTATEVDGAILLSEDAAGTVRLADGSELAFEGIERIEW